MHHTIKHMLLLKDFRDFQKHTMHSSYIMLQLSTNAELAMQKSSVHKKGRICNKN